MFFISGFLFLGSVFIFFIYGIPFLGCLALAWLALFLLAKVLEPWRVNSTGLAPRPVKQVRSLAKTSAKDR